MQTTTRRRATLARCPQHRPPSTGRSAMDPRMVYRRRLEAFRELFADASPKPAALNAITRADPRTKLYDERQREIIHAGIRDGVISRARIIRYRAEQLLDDLAQFPGDACPNDALYLQFMREAAEAVEAQTLARGVATEGTRVTALRETQELIAVAELHCAAMQPAEARS
jgi:hypothetical protein